MLIRVIPEYGRLKRSELPARALALMEKLDRELAESEGETALDWSLKDELRAKSYVGVLQVPGLSLEILPKIDVTWGRDLTFAPNEAERSQANLLYMLSVADELPMRERDLAHLSTQRMPLLEILMRRFAEGLLDELRRGADHAYITRSENTSIVRGRIVFREHLKRNIADRARVFVEYDEFHSDTLLNRVLKRACTVLVRMTRSSWTARCLNEALVHLGDVSDAAITPEVLASLKLHRNNARFESALTFARLVLERSSPTQAHGEEHTLSLLFPMEKVFEGFVGAFIRRHAHHLGLDRTEVHLQAARHQRHLLRSDAGRLHFRLDPDVLVTDGPRTRIILDTKWKRLVPDARDRQNGVSQADIYQLFAYAERYACEENILLYPKVSGAVPKTFTMDERSSPRRNLRIAFIDVTRDLQKNVELLRAELRALLGTTATDVASQQGTPST